MSKTITPIINRFDGGIQNDPRVRVNGAARECKNFDAFTNRHKLTPYRDSEDGDSSAATSQKQNFAIALRTGTTYSLYALGVKSGASTAEVRYKDFSDLDDAGWSTTGVAGKYQASSGVTDFNLFTYYRETTLANSRIYGASGGSRIWSYDPTGVANFDDKGHNLTYTTIGEGLVHSKDDILYIPYDNKIAKYDGSSWTDLAITIPARFVITSLSEYGNFIAIAAKPLSRVGKTVVYLWNRDSTLTTLSESIDWGTGQLNILQEIEGVLVGVSLYGGDLTRVNDRIVFRYYDGGKPQTFLTLQADTSSTTLLPSGKQKIDERLLFMMQITLNGTDYDGVWAVELSEGRFKLAQERTPNNDTALHGSNGILKGFVKLGDYLFQSRIDDASPTYYLSKTNDQASYTASSIFATNINPNMGAEDMSLDKQLMAVSVSCEPLTDEETIKLEYKVDGGSWTEVFTASAEDDTGDYIGDVNIEAVVDVNGAQFEEGREYEFRITSTGGAEITELKYKCETLETQL